jgi:hypothetical protein
MNNDEIIEKVLKEMKKKDYGDYYNIDSIVKEAINKTIALKEQENKKIEQTWGKKYKFLLEESKKVINKKDELLSSLQEKIEDWIKRNKTSWEYLKKHGFPEAKEYGDCIFLNYKLSFPESLSAEEELQKIIKEMGE